jgi:hypothetical protein
MGSPMKVAARVNGNGICKQSQLGTSMQERTAM